MTPGLPAIKRRVSIVVSDDEGIDEDHEGIDEDRENARINPKPKGKSSNPLVR